MGLKVVKRTSILKSRKYMSSLVCSSDLIKLVRSFLRSLIHIKALVKCNLYHSLHPTKWVLQKSVREKIALESFFFTDPAWPSGYITWNEFIFPFLFWLHSPSLSSSGSELEEPELGKTIICGNKHKLTSGGAKNQENNY